MMMDEDNNEMMVDAVVRDCIAVRSRLVNRVITSLYDDVLRPLGLKVSQMNILVVAAKLDPARPADISRILKLDASTLSRNVERMRARGWLEIVSEKDRRAHRLRLTGKGRKLLRRAFPAWEQAQRKAGELLGPDGVELLRRLSKDAGMPA